MVIPLISAWILALIAAVKGWKSVKKKWLTKRIVIYGMPATGKTTFCKFCQGEQITKQYVPTPNTTKVNMDKHHPTPDNDNMIKEWLSWVQSWVAIDTAGQDKHNRDLKEMRCLIRQAHKVLYFVRADQCENRDTLLTIKVNTKQYQQDLQGKLIFVVTHIDKVPNFPKAAWEKEAVIQDVLSLACNKRIEYVSLTAENIQESSSKILESIGN